MIRSIALSVLVAASIAGGTAPALAQGASSGSVSGGRGCGTDGGFCNDAPGGVPGVSGRPGASAPPGVSGRNVPRDPGYYRPDPRPPRPPRPPHRPPHDLGPPPGYYRPAPPEYHFARVSCREARNIVQNEGFRRVRALDCEGRQYQFRASYRGRPVIVVVSSRSGRILDVRRL